MSAALLFPAPACVATADADDPGADARAIVLGGDDSVDVRDDGADLPALLAAKVGAVGRVQGPACTATHIGDRRVLTAGHCVTARALDACETTSFEWSDPADPATRLIGRCVRVHFIAFTRATDLAVVEVDRAPVVAARVDACHAALAGDEVSLLGYPERGPLRWTGYCQLVPDAQGLLTPSFGHLCDTKDGSSGSPLFRREDGAIIGVHLGAANASSNRATALAPYAEPLGLQCSPPRP